MIQAGVQHSIHLPIAHAKPRRDSANWPTPRIQNHDGSQGSRQILQGGVKVKLRLDALTFFGDIVPSGQRFHAALCGQSMPQSGRAIVLDDRGQPAREPMLGQSAIDVQIDGAPQVLAKVEHGILLDVFSPIARHVRTGDYAPSSTVQLLLIPRMVSKQSPDFQPAPALVSRPVEHRVKLRAQFLKALFYRASGSTTHCRQNDTLSACASPCKKSASAKTK